MDAKKLILYISLVLFVFQFAPVNNLLTNSYFAYVYLVANAYIITFAIFAIIENYERIKTTIGQGQSRITNILVLKNENPKKDLLRFIFIAVVIAFSIDIILTKLADQPFFDYFTSYIPGLKEFKDITDIDVAKNLNNTISESQNITGSSGGIGLAGFMNIKIGQIKSFATILIGPTIGPLILFLLRQIAFKKERSNKTERPGARLLFIFLVATAILLSLDLYTDVISGFSSFEPDHTKSESNADAEEEDKILTYGFKDVLIYFSTIFPSLFFWVTTISIWVFDWYLFSRLWSNRITTNW
jgi:hypothetical protein